MNGFRKGFNIGYCGPSDRRDLTDNILLWIGTKTQLWNKVMDEVKLGRYAGPFEEPLYKHFIQSPIGLVPKANNKVRLIFHLSYDFEGKNGGSLNHHTPKEWCSVKYNDIDYAIGVSLKLLEEAAKEGNRKDDKQTIYYGKTDASSAFRQIPLKPSQYKWLLLKAEHPITGIVYYFMDKCLPFGASISCAIYQRFSNVLRHITETLLRLPRMIMNYLDDFFFAALMHWMCKCMMEKFMWVCAFINCPILQEKTEWPVERIIFLGMLLDGKGHMIVVPEEKHVKAVNILLEMADARKTTVLKLQRLTGLLNFLCRAVVLGRAFTREMYSNIKTTTKSGRKLKSYHHVSLDKNFRQDCKTWLLFLNNINNKSITRPFIDLEVFITSEQIDFYIDASKALGFGCVFSKEYTWGVWEESFIKKCDPSIAYLELYALITGVLVWSERLCNRWIIIFCDNQATVEMVNKGASSCKNCQHLLRILTLDNMLRNRRVSVKYVHTLLNKRADALSCLKFKTFFELSPESSLLDPAPLPHAICHSQRFGITNNNHCTVFYCR